jgi:hypothetical protein
MLKVSVYKVQTKRKKELFVKVILNPGNLSMIIGIVNKGPYRR